MVFTGSSTRSIEVAIEGDASSLRNAVAQSRQGLGSLRNSARLAGGALAAISAGGIAKTIQSAAELESAFAEVTTLMDGNRDAAEEFGDTVARLSSEFAVQGGQVETVNSLYDILSAGFDNTASATTVLEQSLKSARAGLAEASTTADLLTTILNGYGMAASDAGQVSDVLFQTIEEGKTRMGELAGSLGRVVPTAAEMGVEIESVSAAVATLTARGQSTDQAVTAINRTLTSLLKPSGDAADVIERMGYESGRALVEQEGLAGALEAVSSHADSSSDELSDVFANVRAMRAALPLANEASADFQENLEAMAGSAGAADDAFQEVSETTRFRFQQALNSLRSEMTRTGETFLPTVTDMIGGVEDLVGAFGDLNQATSGAAGQLALLGGVVGGVGLAFGSTAGLIAGAGAAAFTAWSKDMAGIRSTTTRMTQDVQDSLGRLTGTVEAETNTQLSMWDGFEIAVAQAYDSISMSISQVIDDIVTFTEILGVSLGNAKDQLDSLLSGEGLDQERSEAAQAEIEGIVSEYGERRSGRLEGHDRRRQDRLRALAADDRSLLPRSGDDGGAAGGAGSGGSAGDGGAGGVPETGAGSQAEELMETIREEQERTREEIGDPLAGIKKENRRTADATEGTFGGGPCELSEFLLDPLERAPRASETSDPTAAATGAGGADDASGTAGSRDSPFAAPGQAGIARDDTPERERDSTGRSVSGSLFAAPGQAGIAAGEGVTVELHVDGQKLAEENDRASRKYIESTRVTE
jgi:TP901 family phage tail tape measure protein